MSIRPLLTALALSLFASAAHADAERTFWEITSDGVYAMVGAGELAMAADVRVEDVTPDKDGKIRIAISAAGAVDAMVQGIAIE